MEKVQILGAGPAGLSAAINLAKAGFEVDVFEKNSDVGRRFQGDFQGLENWSENKDCLERLKEMNLAINFDNHPFSKFTIYASKKKLDFSCKRPAFYLVKRGSISGSLDQGLKEQALTYGVHIHFKETIPESKADIIASGPDPRGKFAAARGIVFKTDAEDMALGMVNEKSAIKGYSYLNVVKGHACMCTVLFDKFENLNRCFNETRNNFLNIIDLDIQNSHHMGGIGSFSNEILKKGNRLCVGEAAGIQDLTAGFGIKSALISGFLAAESIVNNLNYEKIAKDYFEDKLKASMVNRFLWEKFNTDNYSLLFNLAYHANDPLKYMNSFYNFNFFQKLIYPFALRYIKNRYPNIN
jgi:flavin-dependent dehydrogenase